MFASLKNKIKEETGSDLSKLTSKITSSTVQRIDSLRGRSHHGSSSSINSIASLERDNDNNSGCYESEEFRKRLQKIENEFTKKLEQKDHEYRNIIITKDKQLQNLEKEKDEALKKVADLKTTLKITEESKQKIVEHQLSLDQIENLQTQEMLKIKNLVLTRETELSEKSAALKEATGQLDKLRLEVSRLRQQEEHLSDIQEESTSETKAVRKNLQNTENELDKLENERLKLKESYDLELESNKSLRQLVNKLEKELNEERNNSLNVQKTLSRVTSEKNTALLRNAEISQQMEMVKQEKRRQEAEMTELLNKLNYMEDENNKYKEMKSVEQHLRNNITELEEQISDKNKNIKTLQLRLADMKKTLQQELRTGPAVNQLNYHNNDINDGTIAVLQPSQISTRNYQPSSLRRNDNNSNDDDVNFKYLKHVVIKFLTCREYEAQHLIKAISTVLKFTADEEKLVIETFEWKRSWFGSKPRLTGTTAATTMMIPPPPPPKNRSTSHS